MAFRVTFFKKNFIPDTTEEAIPDMSGKISGKMSGKILELIANNNLVTIPEIAQKIGVTERTVERHIRTLQFTDKLKREGGKKGGHWVIMNK